MKRIVLIAIIALLGLAGSADAKLPTLYWRVGIQAAYATWGGPPPCGAPVFVYDENAVKAYTVRAGRVIAAYVNKLGAPDDCMVTYGEWATNADPGSLCAMIVHEVGHLWGHEHSADSHDPMYPTFLTWSDVPACAARLQLWGYLDWDTGTTLTTWAIKGPARSPRLWG